MMRLTRRELLPFPVDVVFERAREDLHQLVAWLPDIASIEPIHRCVRASRVERVDRWKTRPLGQSRLTVPTTTVSWLTRSTWDVRHHRVGWAIEVTEPIEAAASRGELSMRSVGAAETEVVLSGEVTVDAKRLGAPVRALAFALRPLVERLVMTTLERNLASLAAGVAEILVAPMPRAS